MNMILFVANALFIVYMAIWICQWWSRDRQITKAREQQQQEPVDVMQYMPEPESSFEIDELHITGLRMHTGAGHRALMPLYKNMTLEAKRELINSIRHHVKNASNN